MTSAMWLCRSTGVSASQADHDIMKPEGVDMGISGTVNPKKGGPAGRLAMNQFNQLDVRIETEYDLVWMNMDASPRPCFNRELLGEIRRFQLNLEHHGARLPYENGLAPIRYKVFSSRHPGVFSLGGDLELFSGCIRRRDARSLHQYAKACIDSLYPITVGFNLPITTIALVEGDALGGGFEAALSCHVLIAERQAQMGLPEILFNLFPGMGAYNLLSQRLNPAQAEKMILSGRRYTAEELYDLGVVDILVEAGEGRDAVREYIRGCRRHHNARVAMRKVRQRMHPVSYDDLMQVCDIWVETALRLSEKDLKVMQRLVRAQDRSKAAVDAPQQVVGSQ